MSLCRVAILYYILIKRVCERNHKPLCSKRKSKNFLRLQLKIIQKFESQLTIINVKVEYKLLKILFITYSLGNKKYINIIIIQSPQKVCFDAKTNKTNTKLGNTFLFFAQLLQFSYELVATKFVAARAINSITKIEFSLILLVVVQGLEGDPSPASSLRCRIGIASLV